MGRKRNQGKARRAAKAKAKEEAKRRGDDYQTTTHEPGHQLAARLWQLQIEEKCKHGVKRVVSTDDFVVQFINAFGSSFCALLGKSGNYTVSQCLTGAKNGTMEFADVWQDSAKLEIVMSCNLCMGTQDLLEGHYHNARIHATFARYFEQYIAVELKQTQALLKWPKIEEAYFETDLHTLVKFFRHRIPCSCLDEKYDEVKHIPKMGDCYNYPQCDFPNGRVERSKTKYCSRCRNATYCSRECQKAHWTKHKPECDIDCAMIAKFEAKRQE